MNIDKSIIEQFLHQQTQKEYSDVFQLCRRKTWLQRLAVESKIYYFSYQKIYTYVINPITKIKRLFSKKLTVSLCQTNQHLLSFYSNLRFESNNIPALHILTAFNPKCFLSHENPWIQFLLYHP